MVVSNRLTDLMAWAVKTLITNMRWVERRSNRAGGFSNPKTGYRSSQFVLSHDFVLHILIRGKPSEAMGIAEDRREWVQARLVGGDP